MTIFHLLALIGAAFAALICVLYARHWRWIPPRRAWVLPIHVTATSMSYLLLSLSYFGLWPQVTGALGVSLGSIGLWAAFDHISLHGPIYRRPAAPDD